MMDFESVDWEVGKEASELDSSLFQENKKSNKKAKKRKHQESVEISIKDNSTNKKDNSTKKKRKTDEKEAEKLAGGNRELQNDTKATEVTTNVTTKEQMGRKEKRQLKWEQKMLRKKLNKGNKSEGLNDSGTGLESQNGPTNAIKTGNDSKTANHDEKNIKKEGQMSRKEKRTLRKQVWDQRKLDEKSKSENVNNSGAGLKSQSGPTSTGITGNDGEATTPGETKVMTKEQMARKERRKQKWKQKLKERKLIAKNNKSEDLNDSGAEIDSQSGHSVVHENGKQKTVEKDKQLGDLKGIKKEKKNKNKKRKLENQNSTGSVNESRKLSSEKTAVKTEVKELNSVNPTARKEMQEKNSGEKETDTESAKQEKKRKSMSKKNKFKGYVKPETSELNVSADKESESPIKSDSNVMKKSKSINTSSLKVSDTSLDKSLHSDQSLKSVKGKKKKKAKQKSIDKDPSTTESVKPVSASNVSEKKGSKKLALDPKILSALLSAKQGKKSINETEVEDDAENAIVDGKEQKKTLLEKSRERLNAARFRYLNELLYTTTGQEALNMFKHDEIAFNVYHEGFQGQVEKWPSNPIDIIIAQIKPKPKHLVLADFGCGDAKLARSVPNKVHSFDLVALNDHVTVCDMSKVPLKDGIVDIAVFCLSLMGTNLTAYLREANRVLKNNGTLMIAEVTSRFHSIGSFVLKVEKMGFKIKQQDTANKMFVMMEFKKTVNSKDRPTEDIQLKPCLYKKR